MASTANTSVRRIPPATERGRRARAAIVDAAATLMYRDGVSGTSLDDVLTVAGSGKSQLYHYFHNKSDLVMAVIERQMEVILAAQRTELDAVDSWEGLERWAAHILRLHKAPGGPFACPLGTIAAELKNDEAYGPALDAAFRQWEAPLARGLEVMRRHGELVAYAEPDRLAAMVIAVLQGGMLVARIRRDVTVIQDSMGSALGELRRWAKTSAE